MDQLEMFREQLRRKPGETQKKEMKKKKDGSAFLDIVKQ